MSRKEIYGACPRDCPDGCSWIVTVENGKAIKLRGNPDQPFTCGTLCTKSGLFFNKLKYRSFGVEFIKSDKYSWLSPSIFSISTRHTSPNRGNFLYSVFSFSELRIATVVSSVQVK